ncbi:MAG: hypothetical protein U0800_18415 [Isosphaeraceae bacterium]
MPLFRLPLFGRWLKQDPYRKAEERRLSYRYPALEPGITIGWWAADQFHTSPGQVLNISLGGMAVESKKWPEEPQNLVVKLGSGTDPGDWVDVDLLGNGKRPRARRGKFLIHMKFPKSCPYEFFTRVTAGDSRECHFSAGDLEQDTYTWR